MWGIFQTAARAFLAPRLAMLFWNQSLTDKEIFRREVWNWRCDDTSSAHRGSWAAALCVCVCQEAFRALTPARAPDHTDCVTHRFPFWCQTPAITHTHTPRDNQNYVQLMTKINFMLKTRQTWSLDRAVWGTGTVRKNPYMSWAVTLQTTSS